MNNFAEIIWVNTYRKVTYYTVAVNDGIALFDAFVDKHTDENKEKLKHILAWIKVIGDKIGAQEQYFRNEAETADASALPPQGVNKEPVYVEYNEETGTEENKPNNLRLYCLRANEHVVFLFNGDIKTAATPQECENVRLHFKMANKLTELIDEAFQNKEIRWINDYTEIEVDDDFLLQWD
ncbi:MULTISPECIES: hypothetical protein [unclassified Empedobacter]|uniref:hypothetical protein n=1 Tax=unclassified Empedobacter TaxID=2643773 RepID=UPI0025C5F274|nr:MULTISPECIES: hypothetical protein [unclassified Empedobacter]